MPNVCLVLMFIESNFCCPPSMQLIYKYTNSHICIYFFVFHCVCVNVCEMIPLFIHIKGSCCCCLVTKYCPTLLWPHGITQARILEWIPFPFPGDFPDLGIEWICVSCIDWWILYHWATWEAGWYYTSPQMIIIWCWLLWDQSHTKGQFPRVLGCT